MHRHVWHSHGAARQRDARRCVCSWVELCTSDLLSTSLCLTMLEPRLVQLVHEHEGRGASSQSYAAIRRSRSASVRVALAWGCTAAGRSTVRVQLSGAVHVTRAEYLALLDYACAQAGPARA